MGSGGLVELKLILAMLEACAQGYQIDEKLHHFWVYYSGRVYPGLPKGSHRDRGGRQARAEIKRGHVKKMIRFLRIDADCASRVLGFPISKPAKAPAPGGGRDT